MHVSIEDQETTITYSRADPYAKVWTSDRTMMTKLDKLVESSRIYSLEETARDKDGDVISKTYLVADKSFISFRKKKKVLSQESREKMSEKMKEMRAKGM